MKTFIFLWFCISGFVLSSQTLTPYYVRPHANNALPSNTVFSIAQTTDGYLYLGTDAGLVRYNGLSYELLDIELKGTGVNGLIADGNNLFCLSFSKELITLRDGAVTIYTDTHFELEKTSRLSIIGDTLFIINQFGLQMIDKNNMQPIKYIGGRRGSGMFWDVFQNTSKETMILHGNLNLMSISDYKKAEDEKDHFLAKYRVIPFQGSHLIHEVNKHIFHQLTEDGIKKQKWETDFLRNQKVHCVQNLNDDFLFVSTYNGLYIMNDRGDLKYHLFNGIPVANTYRDQENTIWVATLNDGVYQIQNIENRILYLDSHLAQNDKVFKAAHNNEQLYLGTHQGWLHSINLVDLNHTKRKLGKDAEVQTIRIQDDTIYTYCEKSYTLTKDLRIVDSFLVTATKDILPTKNGIYYGTSQGIRLRRGQRIIDLLNGNWIRSFTRIPESEEIVANTDFGYYTINSKNEATSFHKDALKFYNKEGHSIFYKERALVIEHKGQKRLLKTDVKPEDFFILDASLFVRTKEAVFEYNIDNLKLLNTWNINLQLFNGPIISFFASQKELILVFENAIQKIPRRSDFQAPPFHLKIRNDAFLKDVINITYAGRLAFDVDILNAIRSRGSCKLYYSFGDEWIEVPKGEETYKVSLERLPSGKYPVFLKAVDQNQEVSEIKTLHVNVAFPYWQQWWFILLVIVGVLLIGFAIFKLRIQRFKAKNAKEIQLKRLEIQSLNSKLEALRSQMNPHFIFNTINTIQAQIMSTDRDQAYDTLNTFSKLIRSALEHSTKNFVGIKEDKAFLENYLQLESVRFNHLLFYSISIDTELMELNPEVPSLITQPFVENAIKHGLMHKTNGKKELKIAYRKTGEEIHIVIRDNGIGRRKSAEINAQNAKHTSYATDAIEKRMNALRSLEHKKLFVRTTDLEDGTEVVIILQNS